MDNITGQSHSLSDAINTATRSSHTKLNKLVIARLPLALSNADAENHPLYVSGLLHITPIYETFETLWSWIMNLAAADSGSDDEDDPLAMISQRSRGLVSRLHFPELVRSQALRKDIIAITGWSDSRLAEELAEATTYPILKDFLAHTTEVVISKPHVLLAYAWVLYMALFSGGKFIRGMLEKAGPATPSEEGHPIAIISTPVLSTHFFRFATPSNGEDIKLAFKKRVAEVDSHLTIEERADIVTEAQNIFHFMIELVGELDEVCHTDLDELLRQQRPRKPTATEGGDLKRPVVLEVVTVNPRLITRDSVCVARERKARKSAGEEEVGDVHGESYQEHDKGTVRFA